LVSVFWDPTHQGNGWLLFLLFPRKNGSVDILPITRSYYSLLAGKTNVRQVSEYSLFGDEYSLLIRYSPHPAPSLLTKTKKYMAFRVFRMSENRREGLKLNLNTEIQIT
jgi:hypothetical protein